MYFAINETNQYLSETVNICLDAIYILCLGLLIHTDKIWFLSYCS